MGSLVLGPTDTLFWTVSGTHEPQNRFNKSHQATTIKTSKNMVVQVLGLSLICACDTFRAGQWSRSKFTPGPSVVEVLHAVRREIHGCDVQVFEGATF